MLFIVIGYRVTSVVAPVNDIPQYPQPNQPPVLDCRSNTTLVLMFLSFFLKALYIQ